MGGHLSHSELTRVFSGQAAKPDVESAVAHLADCPPCLNLAASVIAELKRAGLLVHPSDARGAVVDFLAVQEKKALSLLLARAWWAELKTLTNAEQLARVKTVPALQTRELFDVILEEASATALSNPHRGEEMALVAYAQAGAIPLNRCSEPVKHDLQSAATGVGANCRRLAGNWQGSGAAFDAARSHLARGTGDAARAARLLSLQASLAMEIGHREEALALAASRVLASCTAIKATPAESWALR
jgi:hypothetical protein